MITKCFYNLLVKSLHRRQLFVLKNKLHDKKIASEESEYNGTIAHVPVMTNEVIEYLNLNAGDVFLDMTFGAGGHSKALLDAIPNLKVIGLDRDLISQQYAETLKAKYPGQVFFLLGKFSEVPDLLKAFDINKNNIDGVLFDLGASSMQFDSPERGFSINHNGPLDMRMDGNRIPKSVSAADVIAFASESDLTRIFRNYGEERQARRIARAIDQARHTFEPLKTTKELSDLIETVCNEVRKDKLRRKAHVATKVFQALRIFVNNELNELNIGLSLVYDYLKPAGRAVVISFHSLEDKIVKKHFNNHNMMQSSNLLKSSSLIDTVYEKKWERVNKKVVLPSDAEIFLNPRSRSAKLRAAVKI